jgi:glyoxylase-like metal-dependent hydrolase (beta-lactamase superfamily II)
MERLPTPRRFESSAGRIVYALNFETFPNFFNNVYVVDDGARRVLVDCGSGFGSSNDNLVESLASIEAEFGQKISLPDFDAIVITHAHTDHFGGLGFVTEQCDAPVSVHVLDRRVLDHYEERVVTAARNLELFLEGAGLSKSTRDGLMTMYKAGKERFRSIKVDNSLEQGSPVLDRHGESLDFEVFHVPGHCPGQVNLKIDDILLTADHVLKRITPHQAPESITLNTGLMHYLDSLDRIEKVDSVRIGLGGHENPIENVAERAREIKTSHDERLDKVLEFCAEPRTIGDVSQELFGKLSGYQILMGLEEAGAHVEYLHLRGDLVASNIEELDTQGEPVIHYLRG